MKQVLRNLSFTIIILYSFVAVALERSPFYCKSDFNLILTGEKVIQEHQSGSYSVDVVKFKIITVLSQKKIIAKIYPSDGLDVVIKEKEARLLTDKKNMVAIEYNDGQKLRKIQCEF